MRDSLDISTSENADLKVNNIPSVGGKTVYWGFITIQHKLETDKRLQKSTKCKLQPFNSLPYRISKTENCAVSTEISNSYVQDNSINYTQNQRYTQSPDWDLENKSQLQRLWRPLNKSACNSTGN